MSDEQTRFDGKAFVTDGRGRVPRYVIENDSEGLAVLINQFTGRFETIGRRPLAACDQRLIDAHRRLLTVERKQRAL